MIAYSAPGKIILSGEHAVVYGRPALVAAVNKRLKVKLAPAKRKEEKTPEWKQIESVVFEYLNSERIDFKIKDYKIDIESDIPVGRGMGSSAALAVASVACLLEFFSGKRFEKELVNNLAYKIEKYFHGRPSGIDNSASCFGGLIFFRKEFEFLKVISKLNFKIPDNIQSRLYLVDTGKPKESTKQMVDFVGSRLNENPSRIRLIFSEIERASKQMVVAILKEDLELFAKAMQKNQDLLERLGVVSKRMSQRLKVLQDLGAYKITGAGGLQEAVGFVLFLDLSGEGERFLKDQGFSWSRLKFDQQGLVRL